MKKILSLVLAVIMIMAMCIPAFAAEGNGTTTAAECSHSSGVRPEAQITYILVDNTYHNKWRAYLYYCNACGEPLYASNSATLLGKEEHTRGTGTYVSSTHTGDYSTHYYTMKGKCTICEGSITWKVATRCTKSSCFDPL